MHHAAERRPVVVAGMAAMAGGVTDGAAFEAMLRRSEPCVGQPLALPDWDAWLDAVARGSSEAAGRLRRVGRGASTSLRASLMAAHDAMAMAFASGRPPPEALGIVVAGSNLQLGRAAEAEAKFRREPAYTPPRHGYEFYDTHVMATIAEALGVSGPGFTVGGASASGNLAILAALDLIRCGRATACLVVGPLPELSPLEWHALDKIGATGRDGCACRPFDRAAEGFVPGEACAAVVLEDIDSVTARGGLPLAEIAGAWTGLGGSHLPSPDARSELRAMAGALADAGASVESLDYVSAHATSTPAGDLAECEALRGLLGGRARDVPVNATKALVGHALHAAGVVQLAAVIVQMRGGFVHGTAGLSEPICRDLWLVGPNAVERPITLALSNAFGFGSIAVSVTVRSMEAR
ncbi:beta-ketoacyl synthase N-terminal-like domain-containing protein [Marinivivus vitaminiproducens]|uniref:beta-ketoacyl synthase N-terminal-like domain-containing protein n=1 Tax=Marinivivus vitaminiproducens TaxID=3035935 RepID=UPI002798C85C|nr:beta-ketoacyl synthase N-terminal-like domain-containing protein [Geminicoccaceae bacterium SCSIO 64248]